MRAELDNATFVRFLYKTLLDREPDPDGLRTHVAVLDGGEMRHQLALNVVRSAEFNHKLAALGLEVIPVHDPRLYAGYRPEDLGVFAAFAHANPQPRAGFLTEFVGSRARISSLWDECRSLDGAVAPLPIPEDYHADAVEWIGMLKAVLAASDSFAAMELGAGHGPWIAASAAAAKVRGIRELTLCAVEGDPGRFALLQQNIEDNELGGHDIVLIQGAVGVADGTVRWPRLGDPRNTAGARPLREGNREDEAYLRDWTQDTIEIEVVSANRLLMSRPFWDFVHIDIQGTEDEVCAACAATLADRVRYLVIGTHSRKLDGDVMETLLRSGWVLEHEKPARMNCSSAPTLINLTMADGTQVWRNPRL